MAASLEHSMLHSVSRPTRIDSVHRYLQHVLKRKCKRPSLSIYLASNQARKASKQAIQQAQSIQPEAGGCGCFVRGIISCLNNLVRRYCLAISRPMSCVTAPWAKPLRISSSYVVMSPPDCGTNTTEARLWAPISLSVSYCNPQMMITMMMMTLISVHAHVHILVGIQERATGGVRIASS